MHRHATGRDNPLGQRESDYRGRIGSTVLQHILCFTDLLPAVFDGPEQPRGCHVLLLVAASLRAAATLEGRYGSKRGCLYIRLQHYPYRRVMLTVTEEAIKKQHSLTREFSLYFLSLSISLGQGIMRSLMELSASLDTYRPNSSQLFRAISAGSKSELIINEGM